MFLLNGETEVSRSQRGEPMRQHSVPLEFYAANGHDATTSFPTDDIKKRLVYRCSLEAYENSRINSDAIVRYFARVAKHGVEVLTDQEFHQ